jgi:hypothetical protein
MIPSSYAKAFSFFFPLAIIARTKLYYTRGNVWLLTLFYVLLRPGFVVFSSDDPPIAAQPANW